MKVLRNSCLVLFILLAITSILIVAKQILIDGQRIETLHTKNTKDPIFITNEDLAKKDSVELTIGTETTKLKDVFAILVENKKGEVQLFTSTEFSRFNEKKATQHGTIKESSNSVQNLILQTATASGNANSARLCCAGPYTNAYGAVIARSCEVTFGDVCPQ